MALGQNVNNNSYKDMKERHKVKKTTDDCYTPPEIYEAVKDWVIKEYDLKDVSIERPFWPDGDYTKYEYKENSVVIDNPPFSILSQIIRYYNEHNIKYFLFAPGMVFSTDDRNNYVITRVDVIYNEEIKIPTNFYTNLGDALIRTALDLKEKIEDINKKIKKKTVRKKHQYPDNLITAATFPIITPIEIYRNEVIERVEQIDHQKEFQKKEGKKYTIFGGGFLLSTAATERLKEAREEEQRLKEARGEGAIIWKLSDREKKLIEELDKKAEF